MQTNQRAFKHFRKTPIIVLVKEAGNSFVQVGGGSLFDLREDFYDNAVNTANRAKAQFISAYDFALSGGEPYANWV